MPISGLYLFLFVYIVLRHIMNIWLIQSKYSFLVHVYMNGNLKCSQYLLHAHIILSLWWSTWDLLLVNVNSKLLFKENFVVRLALYIASMKQQKENVFLWLKCGKPIAAWFPRLSDFGFLGNQATNHIDNLPMKPRHFYCLVMNEIQIYIKFIF